jgi:hypothetical protein
MLELENRSDGSASRPLVQMATIAVLLREAVKRTTSPRWRGHRRQRRRRLLVIRRQTQGHRTINQSVQATCITACNRFGPG